VEEVLLGSVLSGGPLFGEPWDMVERYGEMKDGKRKRAANLARTENFWNTRNWSILVELQILQ
jgi:hypothetical protein